MPRRATRTPRHRDGAVATSRPRTRTPQSGQARRPRVARSRRRAPTTSRPTRDRPARLRRLPGLLRGPCGARSYLRMASTATQTKKATVHARNNANATFSTVLIWLIRDWQEAREDVEQDPEAQGE